MPENPYSSEKFFPNDSEVFIPEIGKTLSVDYSPDNFRRRLTAIAASMPHPGLTDRQISARAAKGAMHFESIMDNPNSDFNLGKGGTLFYRLLRSLNLSGFSGAHDPRTFSIGFDLANIVHLTPKTYHGKALPPEVIEMQIQAEIARIYRHEENHLAEELADVRFKQGDGFEPVNPLAYCQKRLLHLNHPLKYGAFEAVGIVSTYTYIKAGQFLLLASLPPESFSEATPLLSPETVEFLSRLSGHLDPQLLVKLSSLDLKPVLDAINSIGKPEIAYPISLVGGLICFGTMAIREMGMDLKRYHSLPTEQNAVKAETAAEISPSVSDTLSIRFLN